MPVEVSTYEFVNFFLILCMEVLKLVEVSHHVKTVRCDDVRFPLNEVFSLHTGDFAHCGKDVSKTGTGPLQAISICTIMD